MKNASRQAVILDNFSSPYIHQAILILKDYNPALESKVIEEAEKIVSEYLKNPNMKDKKQPSKAVFMLFCAIGLVIFAGVLSYII